MKSKEPKYIIAIGASAGGMEEINSFFDHTPLDGVAYVIIQHLSADFKSRMVELLARHSKLEIKEAEKNEEVHTNHVYLIPNDKYMTIKHGRLLLTEKNKQGPHLSINLFFNSLAMDCGRKAIAIVFSGLGADGTEGIKSIKKSGGMIMVRNPETSPYPSMPTQAIHTGLVDFILEPELMPMAIEDFVKNGNETLNNSDDDDDEKALATIIELIKQKTPLDFSEYKNTTILRRTKRRATNGNFTSLNTYLEYLKETPEEITELSKEFLISVTSFFRDPDAFNIIKENIIPNLLKKLQPEEELKIWVAGCATGEEVYTLAILIAEQLTGEFKDIIVKIFATDIDSVAMDFASKGIYPLAAIKNIPAALLSKNFLKEGERYKINPIIRKMVIFAHHDLVKNPPYCNMHLISCRNILIYLTPVLQKKIFSMLLFGLRMDGYLFLGSSENPMPIISSLEVVNKKWKIYKNIKTKRILSFDNFSIPEFLEQKHLPILLRNEPTKMMGNTQSEIMNIELAKELNYLTICIDENNQVIKSFGDTKRYLIQENFNSNLAELLVGSIAIAFNNLSTSARKSNMRECVSGIMVKEGDKFLNVTMTIIPLIDKRATSKVLMVIFTSDLEAASTNKFLLFDEKVYYDKYTENLEEELKEIKDKLQIAYQQLDASNENMQSFNEELISANEEMQSTNEEMQSVNEELHTINTDYQLKNKELLDMNDDLNNYFRSNINGQLFINNELELMKFSPGAVQQINLMESDIGRPINHISTNIKFENIINDVKEVLEKGSLISKEIETINGKWYQMMIMPYLKLADNKINGAIITFNDVTALKEAQTELALKNKSLTRINTDLDHFIHAASHDLLAPLGNIETSINVMNKIALSDEKLADILDIINMSVKTFRLLITDISVIAKIEGDMIKMESVDINEQLDNIVWSLKDKIEFSKATIHRNIEIDKIWFSKKNIRSILFNLISNSIKFKGENSPEIYIQTVKNKDEIILSVKDNGRGMNENEKDKIFEMYGRLNQNIEGSGIGLYLAKKIVNAAGGKIEVESTVNSGSTFTIYLKNEQL
ncbi:chemotaxis protein CheB [Pedobacter alpinus]|uniref:histidine kinase n=1 Tax=Pedobacter alpinus TaxID=1590643 RepID=A0ABW5TU24_9SPHI